MSKLAYEAPRITTHGDIRKLTQWGGWWWGGHRHYHGCGHNDLLS